MKFRQKFLSRSVNPYYYTEILRLEGFDIGHGTIFYSPDTQVIDRERPWMLKIGSYCKITRGCTILTHDYSRSVLRRKYGEFVGEASITEIGNNVFIGVNSIVLMGAKIGSNVIVGAGSVVSGIIPNDVVVAGNPAKVICSLDHFFKKRKERELKSAACYFNSYYQRYGEFPESNAKTPFFSLYTDRSTFDYENDSRMLCNGDNPDDVKNDFRNTEPIFKSYNEFIEAMRTYE